MFNTEAKSGVAPQCIAVAAPIQSDVTVENNLVQHFSVENNDVKRVEQPQLVLATGTLQPVDLGQFVPHIKVIHATLSVDIAWVPEPLGSALDLLLSANPENDDVRDHDLKAVNGVAEGPRNCLKTEKQRAFVPLYVARVNM